MPVLRAHHTGTRGIAYVNGKGKQVVTINSEKYGDSGGVIAELEIVRGDLVRILHNAAGSDTEFISGDAITRPDRGPGRDAGAFRQWWGAHVRHRGRRGRHPLRVRKLAFGPYQDYVSDLGLYSTYFTAHTDLKLDGWELM